MRSTGHAAHALGAPRGGRLSLMRKTVLAALVLGALALGGALHAHAAPAVTVVTPTGQFPQDVQNVQAAVDQGGTVLLTATNAAGVATAFNFGPATAGDGFVTLTRDVTLLGEQVGAAVTTVDGGYLPVRGFDAITTTVRGIAFDGPLYGALYLWGPAGASTTVTGNHIFDVVGQSTPYGSFAEAMIIGGGAVAITDNTVEHVIADGGIGITELDSTGPVQILRNRVTDVTETGIEATRNQGAVTIADNVVTPGTAAEATGYGVVGIEVNGTGAYQVARNDILLETPLDLGIFVFGAEGYGFGPVTSPVVEGNHVVRRPQGTLGGALYDDGIDLAGLVSGAYVGQNRVDGPGFSALSMFDLSFDPSLPSDLGANTFVGNNIAGATNQFVDVFLDDATHDTVLKGHSGAVLDLGTNNDISGFTKGGQPGSGRQVSQATHLRNDVARAARQLALGAPAGR